MPIAVFRDPTHDVTIVDVSDWPGPIDRSVVERMGDPVLVCFGDHRDACPLLFPRDLSETHGIVVEVRDEGAREQAFIESFTGLIDPAVPVRVISRIAHPTID